MKIKVQKELRIPHRVFANDSTSIYVENIQFKDIIIEPLDDYGFYNMISFIYNNERTILGIYQGYTRADRVLKDIQDTLELGLKEYEMPSD